MNTRNHSGDFEQKISMQKKIAFSSIAVLLIFAFTELFAYLGLFALATFRNKVYEPIENTVISEKDQAKIKQLISEDTVYYVHDPDLGWSIKPNGGNDEVKANALGIRSSIEYTQTPPPNRIRIAAFGDSFTHGDNVSNNQTWETTLESLDSRLEVMNFGVGGYGPDQAYLRYKLQGKQTQPNVVLIGFMSENIYRIVNRFRPFYMPKTGLPLAKPRFILNGQALRLLPNPLPTLRSYEELISNPQDVLPQLGVNDYHYSIAYQSGDLDLLATVRLWKMGYSRIAEREPIRKWSGSYNPESEAFHLLVEILSAFYAEVLQDGAIPIVVIFPNSRDMSTVLSGGSLCYLPLIDSLRQRGMRTIDGFSAFESVVSEESLKEVVSGHYTARGNAIFGRYLLKALSTEPLNVIDG